MSARVSAVVNTLNEEENLPLALASVRPWVDEIVVVDMHSDDATREVAARFGAKVYLHERLGYADPARAYALAQATGDWVLVLDADEVVPPRLSEQLRAIARDPAEARAVLVPYRNFVFGEPVDGLGWGPHDDHHMRFFRRDAVYATGEVHNFLHLSGDAAGTRKLEYTGENAILHFTYLSVEHMLEKFNRYTSLEARLQYGKGRRSSTLGAFAEPAREFLRRYLRRGGYRDGWRGLHLSVMLGVYRYLVEAKLRQLEAVGDEAAVRATHRAAAKAVLRGYETADERAP